ncbi:Endothelin-converting enzyme 1 [Pseudarthrobacter chlorophenolicus A6]|uniref:Endothelin-converting enzyme 1 n=1 Tax=Pseudarthrobacter chlorophenolicus (strain ATCC 700700 / DSM 12829 / CIP 107037 / JCM 12360 / KCTC 9906 / NCIMB 13794 / A6) TaxID=452863 RepID=B8H8R0_PSECP|nr:M13-type metalloendopeptidase [Pseudarthrobacter chlorophenolicus]ACL39938.1 Endothelin-converting enzyme 1 [Pseudarthrobacter chlorophenolicus A6]SDQ90975.1 endothelin-converting enzyme Metallo peptidase. MEROPS family M13 [Pseudarthrobacter chlorophenolicus]
MPISGIDLSTIDHTVRPQDDLYQHVNGAWLKATEIPDDRPLEGTFTALRDGSELAVRDIIEEAAAKGDAASGIERKIGGLYNSFMDEAVAEAKGIEPIRQRLADVYATGSATDLLALAGRLFRSDVGGLFYIYPAPDAGNPDRVLLYTGQGGLGLPDESYYRDEKFAPTVAAYRTHVATMLALAGREDAESAADRVVDLETKLASHHWDNVTLRDPQKTYNLKTAEQAGELFPLLATWFEAADIAGEKRQEIVVSTPDFFSGAAALLDTEPLDAWRDWLAMRVISAAAPYLSQAVVDANFAFYGTTISGTPRNKDRWKRGVAVVEAALGEAVGQIYVARHFPESHKARMQTLVGNLIEAYRSSINEVGWMGADTKAEALRKLDGFRAKIGFPDEWIDYSAVEIDPNDLLGNVERAHNADVDRHLDEVGKPVDRNKWLMTPQTVNAYYHPMMNEIVFPAAILQPPFFTADADDAVNYGGIGAVIGHEIGHGFDDQGSQFDGGGALRNWWTDEDRQAFEKLTARLVAQYDALSPAAAPGHHVNGRLTLGENIGDLAGLAIAHKAYRISLEGREPEVLDGLTGHQRFFASWAAGWRQVIRQEEAIRRLATDPHSPNEFRTNAIARNLDAFHEAFEVTEQDEMWMPSGERVSIW